MSKTNNHWWRVLIARILIFLRRLTHSDYSESELNALLGKHVPAEFFLEVPTGKGQFTILQAEITMPQDASVMQVQLLCALQINYAGTPLYRAHIIVLLDALPAYDPDSQTLYLEQLDVRDLYLVNDEYALLKDTRSLLSAFVPRPFQDLVTDTVRSAVGMLTAGGSDALMNYLKLYLGGSKQRVLDYHRPQLERLVASLTDDPSMRYTLNDEDWQEYLFSRFGRDVVVEDGLLRFRF